MAWGNLELILKNPCPDSILRCRLSSIGNPILEIKPSYDRLISTMIFPILITRDLYIGSGSLNEPDIFLAPSYLLTIIVITIFHMRHRHVSSGLIHWGRHKMVSIWQTIFLNHFCTRIAVFHYNFNKICSQRTNWLLTILLPVDGLLPSILRAISWTNVDLSSRWVCQVSAQYMHTWGCRVFTLFQYHLSACALSLKMCIPLYVWLWKLNKRTCYSYLSQFKVLHTASKGHTNVKCRGVFSLYLPGKPSMLLPLTQRSPK